MSQPTQVRFDQAGAAVSDQKRLEDAVAPHRGEVVGVQQRHARLVHLTVERDDDARVVCHGSKD